MLKQYFNLCFQEDITLKKKLLSAFLILGLAFCMTACGEDAEPEPAASEPAEEKEEAGKDMVLVQ